MNNSVFGKTIENLRKWRNILLCNGEERAKKLVASRTFKSLKTCDDLTAVGRLKTYCNERRIYVGFAIVELSKLSINDFKYNFIKKAYIKIKQPYYLLRPIRSLTISKQTIFMMEWNIMYPYSIFLNTLRIIDSIPISARRWFVNLKTN